jgi:sRNA-binding regulator protein Hfq
MVSIIQSYLIDSVRSIPFRATGVSSQNNREGRPPVEPANRKLIRPSFTEVKEQFSPPRKVQKKPIPPDQTNAENFYYLKQMQGKTPMVFVLKDGETLHGTIEWYDKSCLKINREGDPNLLLYKSNIKYMYKDE